MKSRQGLHHKSLVVAAPWGPALFVLKPTIEEEARVASALSEATHMMTAQAMKQCTVCIDEYDPGFGSFCFACEDKRNRMQESLSCWFGP